MSSPRISSVSDLRGDPEASAPPRMRKLEHLERALRRSATGAKLAAVIEVHVEEVIGLVNQNRRVGVVWQRNQGPAFVRAIVDSGFEENVKIPAWVNGITLEELLLRMADVLQRHGSPGLRHAIADQSFDLLCWARGCASLQELFQAFERRDREAGA